MPKGIDFICDNISCENNGSKIPIHGVFPIAEIETVMALEEIVADPFHYSELAEKARNGVKYALIPVPNKKNIKPKGIRVQYFHPSANSIIDMDLLWGTNDERIERQINGEDFSDELSAKVGITLLSVEKLKDVGISCPSCGKDMTPHPWLTGTGISDWGNPNGNKGS